TQLGGLAVDGDPSDGDPAFDLAAGTQSSSRQHFLQAFSGGAVLVHQCVVTPASPGSSSSSSTASSSTRRGAATGAGSAGMPASGPKSSSALMLSMSRSCASVGSSSRLFRLK